MTNKPLTPEQLDDVLKHGTVVQTMSQAQEANKWPNKEDMTRLANAVKARAPIVLFKNGTRFDIRYKTAYKDPAVFVSPSVTDSFFPCGYFSVRKLEEFLSEVKLGVAE